MKKLIIFDLDGTLLDTIEDLGVAVNHALALRGLPQFTIPQYRQMVGHGIRNLLRKALPQELGSDDAYLEGCLKDFTDFYLTHIDVHTRPYPEIVELLNELDAQGVRMAVASNKIQKGTELLIREFFPGIDFVAILGNCAEFPLKPSPEIVELVLAKAGVPKEQAVMVGDSPTDMQTAANGGIDAIAVSWGNRTREQLAGNKIVDTVAELREALISGRGYQ